MASVTDNGDEITGENDVVTYTITVSNDGNVNLTDVTLQDVLTDNNNNPLNLSGPVLASVTAGSSTATLLVNGVLTFTATTPLTNRQQILVELSILQVLLLQVQEIQVM